jgi:alpha-glucosidase (family GH31 glycosyl hydrolase)
MSILKKLNLIQSNKSKSAMIFESLFSDFRAVQYKTPDQYVEMYWEEYQNRIVAKNNSLNGKVFEHIITTLLYREGILPFYLNAKVTYVADTNFDITLFNNKTQQPIVLSVKTTLRERYKQAEWEALRLKDVHKGAKSYLITIDDNHEYYTKKKQEGVIRLNEIIYALSPEFNAMIYHLKSIVVSEAPMVKVIESNIIVR